MTQTAPRARLILPLLLALSACGTTIQQGGPALVSGRTPADTNSNMAEPEPLNSLPPGAQGMGTGPNATQPSYGAVTFRNPHL